MPAKDLFHDTVKKALQKEGWLITDDPLHLKYGGLNLYVDLGAEKILAAEKAGQKIAVEIKSFAQLSPTNEFHKALGQFLGYRLVLKQQQPERFLYLAIPNEIYQGFLNFPYAKALSEEYQVKYLVYSVMQETIVKWLT
jgi:XisH protein